MLGNPSVMEVIELPPTTEDIGLPSDEDAYFGWFRVTGQFAIATDNANLIGTFSEANDGNVNYLSTSDFNFLATHYAAAVIPNGVADINDGTAYTAAKSLQLKWQAAGSRTTRYAPILWPACPALQTEGQTAGSPKTTWGGSDIMVPQKFSNGPLYVNDGGTLKALHSATLAGTMNIVVSLFGVISSDNKWLSKYSRHCGSSCSPAVAVPVRQVQLRR